MSHGEALVGYVNHAKNLVKAPENNICSSKLSYVVMRKRIKDLKKFRFMNQKTYLT